MMLSLELLFVIGAAACNGAYGSQGRMRTVYDAENTAAAVDARQRRETCPGNPTTLITSKRASFDNNPHFEVASTFNALDSQGGKGKKRCNQGFHGWTHGWDKVGALKLTFKGNGYATINYGNCWDKGAAKLYVNSKWRDQAGSSNNNWNKVYSFAFAEGDTMQLKDEDGNSIVLVKSIKITMAKDCNIYQAMSPPDGGRGYEAGTWGGPCTCPDGTTYTVGDVGGMGQDNEGAYCQLLACYGGEPGECEKKGLNADFTRKGVFCAPPPPPTFLTARGAFLYGAAVSAAAQTTVKVGDSSSSLEDCKAACGVDCYGYQFQKNSGFSNGCRLAKYTPAAVDDQTDYYDSGIKCKSCPDGYEVLRNCSISEKFDGVLADGTLTRSFNDTLCWSGWTEVGDSNYAIISEPRAFRDAAKVCDSLADGAGLAAIESKEEQDQFASAAFLERLDSAQISSLWNGCRASSRGASDAQAISLVWDSTGADCVGFGDNGDPFNVSDVIGPTGGNCVSISLLGAANPWARAPCNSLKHFVCELPSATTTTRTSTSSTSTATTTTTISTTTATTATTTAAPPPPPPSPSSTSAPTTAASEDGTSAPTQSPLTSTAGPAIRTTQPTSLAGGTTTVKSKATGNDAQGEATTAASTAAADSTTLEQTTSALSTGKPTQDPIDSQGQKTKSASSGAIAGIIVGLLLVLAAGLAAVWWWRNKHQQPEQHRHPGDGTRTTTSTAAVHNNPAFPPQFQVPRPANSVEYAEYAEYDEYEEISDALGNAQGRPASYLEPQSARPVSYLVPGTEANNPAAIYQVGGSNHQQHRAPKSKIVQIYGDVNNHDDENVYEEDAPAQPAGKTKKKKIVQIYSTAQDTDEEDSGPEYAEPAAIASGGNAYGDTPASPSFDAYKGVGGYGTVSKGSSQPAEDTYGGIAPGEDDPDPGGPRYVNSSVLNGGNVGEDDPDPGGPQYVNSSVLNGGNDDGFC